MKIVNGLLLALLGVVLSALPPCPAQGMFFGQNWTPSGGGSATYTSYSELCVGTSAATSCTGTQTSGDLIVIHAYGYGSASVTCSASDGTNSFTATPHSPAYDGSSTERYLCVFYRVATASGSTTYTVTWGGGVNSYSLEVDEAAFTGTFSFDKDSTYGTASTATPIALPTITPASSGELLDNVVFPNGTPTIAGATWTATGSGVNGIKVAYVLSSASGATAVDWSDTNNPDAWVDNADAFQ